MASEFSGRQRECRVYTAGCVNKMVVSVTGPRAVNELEGPVIPGMKIHRNLGISEIFVQPPAWRCLISDPGYGPCTQDML